MALTRPRLNQLQDSDFKSSCRVVTSANISLTGGAPATVDGVNLQVGDRVLVAGQTDASQNGIYFISTLGSGSNGTWTRTLDANANANVTSGLMLTVTEGTSYASSVWRLTTVDPITIGTTELSFIPELENGNVYVKSVDVTTENQTIDLFASSGVTSVRWVVSATDNVNSRYRTSTIDLVSNGTTVNYIEYGVLLSDSSYDVITVTPSISSGNIILTGTGDSANVSVRVNRMTLGSSTTTGFIKSTVSTSGSSRVSAWSVENSAITSANGDRILVDVSSSAVTVTLPSNPGVGNSVRIVDAEGNAGTNNITVARNGSKILGLEQDLTISTNNQSVELVYYSTARGWVLV